MLDQGLPANHPGFAVFKGILEGAAGHADGDHPRAQPIVGNGRLQDPLAVADLSQKIGFRNQDVIKDDLAVLIFRHSHLPFDLPEGEARCPILDHENA